MTLCKKSFENIVRKGENAANQHFLLFPQCFVFFPKQISTLSSTNDFNLDQSKILLFGKVLTHSHTMTPFDAPGKQAF